MYWILNGTVRIAPGKDSGGLVWITIFVQSELHNASSLFLMT